jgi:hypothetical protein
VNTASSPRLRSARIALAPDLARPSRVRVQQSPGVVDQVRLALKARNRLAASLGAVLGGFVPIASYTLAHGEIDASHPLYAQLPAWLVVGALLFSARSVYAWGRQAFGEAVKALGFVVLLEGVLVASQTPWLSCAALAILVAVNAVATAVGLVAR